MTTTSIALASAELDGSPKEIQLFPLGKLKGRDGRGPYLVRDIKHAQQIVSASHAYVGSGQIPIDYDHQLVNTLKTGTAAPAAGWITQLHAREDGIWAEVQWTDRASAHLQNREYRYVSPVFSYDPKTSDVKMIASVGLTNLPNLDLQAVASQENPTMNDETAARIRALLSLAPDADDATVIQAISNLTGLVVRLAGAAAPDAGNGGGDDSAACSASLAVHPQAAMAAQRLASSEMALHAASVQSIIEKGSREGKITPAMKDWAVANCTADPDNFQALMSVMPVIVPGGAMLPNTPPRDGGSGLSAQQEDICRNLNLPANALSKTR